MVHGQKNIKGAWMFFCCECCVLSGRGLCDGLITRPEESYRLWRVVVCDQETSYARRLKPARGLQNTNSQWVVTPIGRKKVNLIVQYRWVHSLTFILINSNIARL